MTSGVNTLVNVKLSTGWNLLSLPVTMSSCAKNALFPTAASNAFAYEGSYVQRDTLHYCEGFWLNFAAVGAVPMVGPARPGDSVAIKVGWNLIGAISAPVAVGEIVSVPGGMTLSNFFGYSGSYTVADSLHPGYGYWVNSKQAGKLYLSTAPGKASSRIHIQAGGEQPPSPPGSGMSEQTSPLVYHLAQPYPSPFNPATTVRYVLPMESRVTVRVYTLIGQVSEVLVDGVEKEGEYAVTWNASRFASGVYLVRLDAKPTEGRGAPVSHIRKIVLMK
jgi:hypothetical protein